MFTFPFFWLLLRSSLFPFEFDFSLININQFIFSNFRKLIGFTFFIFYVLFFYFCSLILMQKFFFFSDFYYIDFFVVFILFLNFIVNLLGFLLYFFETFFRFFQKLKNNSLIISQLLSSPIILLRFTIIFPIFSFSLLPLSGNS